MTEEMTGATMIEEIAGMTEEAAVETEVVEEIEAVAVEAEVEGREEINCVSGYLFPVAGYFK